MFSLLALFVQDISEAQMITQTWVEAVLGILYSLIDCDSNALLTYYASIPLLGEDQLSAVPTLKLHYNI